MFKRTYLLTFVLLLVAAPSYAVEMFDKTIDVLWPPISQDAVGSTVFQGLAMDSDGELSAQYLITGYGDDIWGDHDQFHFAYRTMTGGVRISADFEWVDHGSNDWAKYGVMLRASEHTQSPTYQTVGRGLNDFVGLQARSGWGEGSWGNGDWWKSGTPKLGIQRVMIGGLPFVESLVDWGEGAGWERVGDLRQPGEVMAVLPDEMLVGVCVTSHSVWEVATALVNNIAYEVDPQLVGPAPSFPLVPGAAAKDSVPSTAGFQIHSAKPLITQGWGWAAADELLTTGLYMGAPMEPGSEGFRIDPVVNLRDSGSGPFGDDNSFPGIDPFEQNVNYDNVAGDDDNNFGTEVLANIYLTAGLHIIGANSDDGTIIEIGGVEVARTEEWKGASNRDYVFDVEADGWYFLRALNMEGGGGANLELHEILANGTRILLGDTAAGGSPVVIPEPATIALLGLGGLALIRRKRS